MPTSLPSHAPCRALPALPVRQAGASLVEFSLVALPLMMAGLGCVELGWWLQARQTASLALLEAARAGVADHARPDSMALAFEQALLPLFPPSGGRSSRDALRTALARRGADTGQAPWRIEVLAPTSAAYLDFSDDFIATALPADARGLPAINHAYQPEQDAGARSRGWLEGRGPHSGMTIFQANTLVLRLNYPHKPALPGMSGLLRMLGTHGGSYRQHAMAHGYLPIVRDIALPMQSHPVNWPWPSHGKIVGPEAISPTATLSTADCHSWWCLKQRAVPASMAAATESKNGPWTMGQQPAQPAPFPEGSTNGPSPAIPGPAGSPSSGTGTPGTAELTVAPDDPACGVTLCCL